MIIRIYGVRWRGFYDSSSDCVDVLEAPVERARDYDNELGDTCSDQDNSEFRRENFKSEEFILTAYCSCEKCCGKWALNRPKDEYGNDIVYTATGTVAKQGRTIAVDPEYIEYGTKVIIDGVTYVAEDCGGAIKGNRIDVYFSDHQRALEFGKCTKTVYIERM